MLKLMVKKILTVLCYFFLFKTCSIHGYFKVSEVGISELWISVPEDCFYLNSGHYDEMSHILWHFILVVYASLPFFQIHVLQRGVEIAKVYTCPGTSRLP